MYRPENTIPPSQEIWDFAFLDTGTKVGSSPSPKPPSQFWPQEQELKSGSTPLPKWDCNFVGFGLWKKSWKVGQPPSPPPLKIWDFEILTDLVSGMIVNAREPNFGPNFGGASCLYFYLFAIPPCTFSKSACGSSRVSADIKVIDDEHLFGSSSSPPSPEGAVGEGFNFRFLWTRLTILLKWT